MFKESTFVLKVPFNILLKVKLSIKSKNNRNVDFFFLNSKRPITTRRASDKEIPLLKIQILGCNC